MFKNRTLWLFSLLIAAWAFGPLGGMTPASAAIDPGDWVGTLMLPNRATVEFTITIGVRDTGEQWGTISIPSQGVHEAPLDSITFNERTIAFSLASVGAEFSGRTSADGGSVVGVLNQKGKKTPFRLRRPAPPTERPGLDKIKNEKQRWEGVAKLPGVDLEFMVTFSPAPTETGWSGVVDIPLQGVKDLALKNVALGDEINFTIHLDTVTAPPPATFILERTTNDHAAGSFTQAGSNFLVEMSLVTDPNETIDLPRPQTPKPPFPYTQREVTYTSPVDGVTLAGTLTVPPGGGRHPVVLMITGSGAQDRDETLLGHKPFWVIADALSRQGVAVLRMDDRGVGGSGGDTLDTVSATNVADVIAGVEFLKAQPEVDPQKIGLIGHSEGGWTAPIAASKTPDIAYIVLLSAPGVTGKELLLIQRDLIRKTAGVPPERRRAERAKQQALLDAIEHGDSDEEIDQKLRLLALAEREGFADAAQFADNIVAQQSPMIRSKWYRDILTLDSRPALRTLKIPVLAIAGSIDRQVPPDPDLSNIRAALDSAGNSKSTLVTLPGLNHLLQVAQTGLPGEYLMIQQTISPDVLKLITSWIRERTGLSSD